MRGVRAHCTNCDICAGNRSDRVPAPLAVSMALPLAQPSVGSRNPPPPLSTVTLPQLRMLFQSTHEDRQSAEALAETGERIVKSPLQRTLTAHIMSRWANHEGTLAHISPKRSIEMLELQCTQRFPARPAHPESSVFSELFPVTVFFRTQNSHHYGTLFLQSLILYGEFVVKNETNSKMEIPQNLQNPATIYKTVIFSQISSERMH